MQLANNISHHNNKSTKNQRRLLVMRKLYRTLTYEGSTIALLAGYQLIGYGILLIILTASAIIYSPYLIKTLINLKKWNWIFSFVIIIIVPLILMFINSNNPILKTTFSSIALLMFYLFCWILKFSVHSWIEQIEYSELDFVE